MNGSAKQICFKNGTKNSFDILISTTPLNELVSVVREEVPEKVRSMADRLTGIRVLRQEQVIPASNRYRESKVLENTDDVQETDSFIQFLVPYANPTPTIEMERALIYHLRIPEETRHILPWPSWVMEI